MFKSLHGYITCYLQALIEFNPRPCFEESTVILPGTTFLKSQMCFHHLVCMPVYVYICSENQQSLHALRQNRADTDECVPVWGRLGSDQVEFDVRTSLQHISPCNTPQDVAQCVQPLLLNRYWQPCEIHHSSYSFVLCSSISLKLMQ